MYLLEVKLTDNFCRSSNYLSISWTLASTDWFTRFYFLT